MKSIVFSDTSRFRSTFLSRFRTSVCPWGSKIQVINWGSSYFSIQGNLILLFFYREESLQFLFVWLYSGDLHFWFHTNGTNNNYYNYRKIIEEKSNEPLTEEMIDSGLSFYTFFTVFNRAWSVRRRYSFAISPFRRRGNGSNESGTRRNKEYATRRAYCLLDFVVCKLIML